MNKSEITHLDSDGNPQMVDITHKQPSRRTAKAMARVKITNELIAILEKNQNISAKGSVFQVATLAGIMAAKRTAELIPLCHSISLEDCKVDVYRNENYIIIETHAETSGKTGVEMEALTAASIAALTVYDMCKAISHEIVIEEIKLIEKTGGKKDYSLLKTN